MRTTPTSPVETLRALTDNEIIEFALRPGLGVLGMLEQKGFDRLIALARKGATLSQPGMAGWKLVPMEPTEAMIEAAISPKSPMSEWLSDFRKQDYAQIYRAMVRYTIEGLPASPMPVERNAVLAEAADILRKRRENYHEEHAIYDYETGATEYPGNGLDFMSEWEELEEEIRALSTPPAAVKDDRPLAGVILNGII